MKYQWRYGIVDEVTITNNNIIGVGEDDIIHDEDDSLYVSASTGNDTTGDGSYSNPFATIQKAIGELDTQVKITILDSEVYYTNEVASEHIIIDGITLQAIPGQQPIITIDTAKEYDTEIIELANEGQIINITIQGQILDEDITGILLTEGTVKNCEVKDLNYCGIDIVSGTVQNTIIHDINGNADSYGIVIESTATSATIEDCLLYNCGMVGIQSDTAKVTISHCTIIDNLVGVQGLNNAEIELNDNIIYNNIVYDIDSNNVTNGINCIAKTKYTIVGGTVITANPLLNENYGLTYTVDSPNSIGIISPCILIASDGRDLGCYNVTRIINTTIAGSFETERPLIRRERKEPVNPNYYVTYNKKIINYADGTVDIVYLQWPDNYVLNQSELLNIITAYETDGYIQLDEGYGYSTYIINKNNNFQWVKALNIEDNTYAMSIELELIKI
jgi:hypothetical protein